MGLTNVLEATHGLSRAIGSAQTGGTTSRKSNPLAGWQTSIHATATNKLAPQTGLRNQPSRWVLESARPQGTVSLGSYGTVSRNGCLVVPRAAQRPGAESLLRAMDDQTCLTCHNGSAESSLRRSPMSWPKWWRRNMAMRFRWGTPPTARTRAVLLNQNHPCYLRRLP